MSLGKIPFKKQIFGVNGAYCVSSIFNLGASFQLKLTCVIFFHGRFPVNKNTLRR